MFHLYSVTCQTEGVSALQSDTGQQYLLTASTLGSSLFYNPKRIPACSQGLSTQDSLM